ncbi:MAG: pyridoxamine 5'-phosphate oxidase family protein [Pseudomonadota bacterium]
MTAPFAPTDRSRVRVVSKRARYDRDTVHAILDAMPLCHVGYVVDGKPIVTPTLQWREGDHVYWHGSNASRALRTAAESDVCLTVSLLDGLVLARSGFHHSANYRSVQIYGAPSKVEDVERKTAALETFVERLYPGRWDQLRPMTPKELRATTLLSLPLTEASAKLREGDPVDDEEDYDTPVWAGVLPITLMLGEPVPDPRNLEGVRSSDYGLPAWLGRKR